MRGSNAIRLFGSAIALAICFGAFAPGASAQTDYRIRSVAYDPGRVVNFAVLLGYQAMIEFAPGERIENVSIGDSVSWQVTPSRSAEILFVKPVRVLRSTNMIVVTNLRRYTFELAALEVGGRNDARATYSLRFDYPADPADAPARDPLASVDSLNFEYASSGAAALYPARVFDDGQSTYFQFADDTDLPAIYVVGNDGREELVNAQMRGLYLVADRVSAAFVLRYGRLVARVSHGAAPPADAAPPRARRP